MARERSDENRASLPDGANLEWLRKHAKQRLRELRKKEPDAKLADAQLLVAREHGFPSWRALKAHVDSLSIEGQLFAAAKAGDLATVKRILKERPELRDVRDKPYEHSLLHAAAQHGHRGIVEHLIELGIDVNYREKGDNTVAMHWAAAAGSLPIVRRLADAGSDVIGHGDDHAMEIIGWASMWDGAQDDAHRAVVDFLLSRGARHHIFSAIAMDLPDEVRRIAREDPKALEQRQSHNESFRPPLHYAVSINRPKMVELLLELGADPFQMDGSPWHYAPMIEARNPTIDLPIMRAYAAQEHAPVLFAHVALHDWDRAERLLRERPDLLNDNKQRGTLHLMAKRGDAAAVRWLLDHGFDADELWDHYDAKVTPLHMAAWGGHVAVAKTLLDAGADPTIKDSKHDGDALGWAEFFDRTDVVRLIRSRELQSPA